MKMSILEYICFEDYVPSELRRILKNLYFTDYGKETEIEINDDNTIKCTFIKSRRYHEATKIENRENIVFKISKTDGKILSEREEFTSKKLSDREFNKRVIRI